jgi:hypothetical protein
MFYLDFPIPASPDKINIKDSMVLVGSCFADNIGSKLSGHKFNCLSNPFGTIYNPISICQILEDSFTPSRTTKSQDVFYHWQVHSRISALTENELSERMDTERKKLQARLLNANWLIITLGSAFAYRLNETGEIVANCHKIAQSAFTKELLSIEELERTLSSTLLKLTSKNPELRIILTVSPVRHFREGLVENNRSKSRLIEVVQNLSWEFDRIKYFPAYEILIDELRDYRFYAKDRVHPSEEAIDYIWQKFNETYFDQATRDFVKEWGQIRASINHRPIHPASDEHQKFLRKTILRLEKLSSTIDVTEEVSLLQKRLL